ncbi:MAG: OmpA family protein [Desulfobacterales bacterium]|nr:OmpA family protein [Desulfobacterales bacterium]
MMRRFASLIVLITLFFAPGWALAAGDPNDAQGTKDPPIFSRMPNFHIYNGQETEFDRFEFTVGQDKKEAVEGRHYYVNYYANEGITLPSGLQIIRNYTNAAKAINGQQLYEWDDGGILYVTLKIVRDDAEIWAEVSGAGNGMYTVHIIEKQLMTQAVVADAASLAGSIHDTGKAAVYGIYFDTGKSEIKPASEPALKEIAKLLQSDPKLKLYVVGHTDNTGAFDANIKLSKDRAGAVVKALTTQHGIAADRLLPFGAGPTAPAASNDSDAGRAKNRRVELVKQ